MRTIWRAKGRPPNLGPQCLILPRTTHGEKRHRWSRANKNKVTIRTKGLKRQNTRSATLALPSARLSRLFRKSRGWVDGGVARGPFAFGSRNTSTNFATYRHCSLTRFCNKSGNSLAHLSRDSLKNTAATPPNSRLSPRSSGNASTSRQRPRRPVGSSVLHSRRPGTNADTKVGCVRVRRIRRRIRFGQT